MTENAKIDKLRITIISTIVFAIGIFYVHNNKNEPSTTSLSHGWNILLSNGPRILYWNDKSSMFNTALAYTERDIPQ